MMAPPSFSPQLILGLLTAVAVLTSVAKSQAISQPRIATQAGNLIFQTGTNHNISFQSGSGAGRVDINGVDFGTLSQQVSTTKTDLTHYQSQTNAALERTAQDLQSFEDQTNNQLTSHTTQLQTISNQVSDLDEEVDGLPDQLRDINNRINDISSNLLEDNCQPNQCQNGGTCIDMYTSYKCFCPANWGGTNCESDTNECQEYVGTAQACLHGSCQNTPGAFICNCDDGWYGVLCNVQQSSCSAGSAQELCGHGTCLEQGATYTCLCDNGWTHGPGTPPRCTQDINECEQREQPCSAGVACTNLQGTYVCGSCPLGYTGNGHVCSDINECLVANGGCSTNPLVECHNIVGSYLCSQCPEGYQGNGQVCVWVGVCSINNGGCDPNAHCIENTALPNRICRCATGWTGSGEGPGGCSLIPGSEGCNANPCENGGRCESNGQGAYTCDCVEGYEGLHCENEVDECASNPCQNGGTCHNTVGSYTCSCQAWYTGPNCEEHRESCGGILNTQVGNLRFPADDNLPYPPNVSCAWRITVPTNMIITVTFTSFHMESHPSCDYDFLQINDGPTAASHHIGKFCGTELPLGGTFNTTHNQLYMWFRSDHSVQGGGLALHWVAQLPSCGGVITGETHGTITSPGYPGNYPTNRDCVWTIEVPAGQTITFTFGNLDLEHHESCAYDYLEVLNGLLDTDESLVKYCSSVSPPPLTTTTNEAFVRFHSDQSATGSGFSINWHASTAECGASYTQDEGVVISPNYPNHYDHVADCIFLIAMPSGGPVTLTFTHFDLETASVCQYDYLEIYNGGSELAPLVGRFCGTEMPGPIAGSTNMLYLKFHTDTSVSSTGFRATWGLACGGTFSSPQGALMSPLYPGSYPHDKDCYYHVNVADSHDILLTFFFFDVEDGNNDCDYDYLSVYDGASAEATLIGRYCGGAGPGLLSSTGPDMFLHFHTDGSVANQGFYANYTSVPSDIDENTCGQVLTDSEGSIVSPGHPGLYPHGIECQWTIIVAPGSRIRLTFELFNVESHPNCVYDYLAVYDNATSTDTGGLLGKYCGSAIPPVLTSIENIMTIHFVTDSSVTSEGFSLSYSSFNSTLCGGALTSLPGLITSPNYPDHYPHQRECVWTISAPNNHQILLNFTSFALEQHTNCQYDYLELRNGGYSNSPLIGQYCGNTIDNPVVSHGNRMWIKFKSDFSLSAPGFRLWYEDAGEGCGADLTSPSGSFVSPNYPSAYNHNGECYWTVTVARGSTVTVVFVDMDIESHSTCVFDYVEVFDGPLHSPAPSLGRFCGTTLPHPVESTSNQVTIKFRADYSISGRGFHGAYFASCQNQELSGRYGVIESPNYPNAYPASRECSWIIRGHQGDNINVTFYHMEIEHGSACQHDYVLIRDGDSPSSPLIGTYCGESLPPAIASSGNALYIRFVSDASLAYNGFRLEWVTNSCGEELTAPSGVLLSPNYPQAYPVLRTCAWLITVDTGSAIQFTINDIELENNCVYDRLEVYNGRDDSAPSLGQFCGTTPQGNVLSSTGNVLYVIFHSDTSLTHRGFNASYTTIDGGCGGYYTAAEGQLTSKNYPNNYPHNTFCEYNITVAEGRTVELSFTEFNIEAHDSCIYDYVAVYDGANENATELLRSCGTDMPNGTIVSSSNRMYMKMVTDSSLSGPGFKAQYKTGCGGYIQVDEDGALSTPNFPGNYDSSMNCSWVLTGSQAVDRITLLFTHMDLEESSNCTHDYVEIRMGDNPNAPLYGSYCGTAVPSSITSLSRAIFIRFISDTAVVRTGFRVAYSKSFSFCGGNLTSEHGSFNSPQYPNSYPNGAECVWMLNSSPGNQLQLSFSLFSLQYQADCNYDYVEIREGGNLGNVLGRYCGNQVPQTVIVGHSLWVKFRSDQTTTGQGFMAHFSALHGGDLTGVEGQIASPLYPFNYPHNDDYVWTITVDNDLKVLITFIEMDMETSGACQYDYVRFRDGGSDTAPVVQIFCGEALPEPFTSNGNQMRVEFHSDQSVSSRGFLLKWEATSDSIVPTQVPPTGPPPCEYVLNVTSTPQNISNPGFPGYDNNEFCVWRLYSPPGTKVTVDFTFIDIEYHGTCVYDWVRVYAGHQSSGNNWIARLCGRPTLQAYSSPSNVMTIAFSTDYIITDQGFTASVYQSCGGSFVNQLTGTMTSPQYPSPYPVGALCEWTVQVATGRTIEYSFEGFSIQSSGGCNNDYLMLLNGGHADSPPLASQATQGRYCGTTAPVNGTSGNLVTSSNLGYVKFVSDGSASSATGFTMTFTEKNVVCGGSLVLTHDVSQGTFATPNYPGDYPNNADCVWIITAPSTERVQLDFNTFDVETHPSCTYDMVDMRDGGTPNSPLLQRSCGRVPPATVKSSGNIMYVRFLADHSVGHTGFLAQYKIAQCGGTYTGLTGVITSPNYPQNYENNMDCEWYITAPTGHFLTLTFNAFQLQLSNECTADRVEVHERNRTGHITESIGSYCGPSAPAPIATSDSFAYIKFRSDASSVNSGFHLTYNASIEVCGGDLTGESGIFTSPNYPGQYPHSRRCVWRITVPEGRRVTLTFNEFNIEDHSACYWDYVRVVNGLLDESPVIDTFCGALTDHVVSSSGNTMLVIFSTDGSVTNGGFSASYSSNEDAVCGGLITGPINSHGFITSPGYNGDSGNYTNNQQCVWRFQAPAGGQSSIRVAFTDFRIERHGECIYDFVELREGSTSPDGRLIGRYCGDTPDRTPPALVSPYSGVWMAFISDFSIVDRGFRLVYNFTNCGGVRTDSLGAIMSPNFPSNYDHLDACAWEIVAEEGYQIELSIESFNLEQHPKCDYDWVEIFNGGSVDSPSFGKYCGTTQPTGIKSQSNRMRIEFHSDISSSHPGFRFVYTAVPAGCGGTYHSQEGYLTSPGYPGLYPANTECEWTIIAAPGYRVLLTVNHPFEMEVGSNCDVIDYVQLSDVHSNGTVTELDRYCGTTPPPPTNSSYNTLKVKFHSNAASNHNGFSANWTTICGGIYDGDTGVIVSPGYPDQYEPNLLCEYIIQAHAQRFVVMHFDENFHIATSYGCQGDYVMAREGASNRFLGRFCGHTAPQAVASRSSLIVTFRSNSAGGDVGFRGSYTVSDCGGNFTEPTGVIRTPTHPVDYHNDLNCTWRITVQPQRVVKLKFTEFDVESHSSCVWDYVDVRDGDSLQSPLLGRLCGSSIPGEIISTGVSMTINFITDSSVTKGGFIAGYESALGPEAGCGGVRNVTSSGGSGTITDVDLDNDGNYENNLGCMWTVWVPEGQVVSINLHDVDIEGHPSCAYDGLLVYDGLGTAAPVAIHKCDSANAQFTSASNVVTVRFYTDSSVTGGGFTLNYQAVPSLCGGALTTTTTPQTLSSPGTGAAIPPSGLNCRWLVSAPSGSQVRVKVTSLSMTETVRCQGGYLQLVDNPLIENGLLGEDHHYCSSPVPQMDSRFQSLTINFVTQTNSPAQTFSLTYETATCDHTYTADNGRIVSPRWPQNYPQNVNCLIRITVAPGNRISLFFKAFAVESHSNCGWDFLKIFDGTSQSSPSLDTHCGYYLPEPVVSSSNNLLLWFKTDGSVTHSGFDTTYTSSPSGCGGNLTGMSGAFASPEYPAVYPSDSQCAWVIRVPPRYLVQLNVVAMDIAQGADGAGCGTDFLQVRDGAVETAPLLGQYCGSEAITAQASANTMYVKFVSQSSGGTGFRATYSGSSTITLTPLNG